MTSQTANALGLMLGIVGVVIIFFWGPPQPYLETGMALGLEDATTISSSGKTVAEHNREIEAIRHRYVLLSRLGLTLIGVGFVFQFIAIWLPSASHLSPADKRKETP